MNRDEILRIIRTLAPGAVERRTDCADVEIMFDLGAGVRERSRRPVTVHLLCESDGALWHARLFLVVGWHHEKVDGEKKSFQDGCGTAWEVLTSDTGPRLLGRLVRVGLAFAAVERPASEASTGR